MGNKKVVEIKEFLNQQGCNTQCILSILDITANIEDELKQLSMRKEYRELSCEQKLKCLQDVFQYFKENATKYINGGDVEK